MRQDQYEPRDGDIVPEEEVLERVKGIEPSTRSLGSYCSTTELHPPTEGLGLSIQMHGDKGA